MTSNKRLILKRFFSPEKVAFVGASERGTYPAGIMQNLIEHGYANHVYPVNPKRDQVFGIPCYPSLLNLPQKPDLALLTVPRSAVIPVIKDALQVGIPAGLIISAGFAEADEHGKTLQKQLKTLIKGTCLRLIGPNCAGLASLSSHFIATRLFGDLVQGPLSFVSQSGALMMSLQGLFSDRQIGMNHMVSLGNQVDVSQAEMLNCLAEDASTQVITTFMEGVRQGRQLSEAFKTALTHGKPIILLKSGRTARGRAAAATHTAALAGEDRIFKAICDQYGVILADDIDEMMNITELTAAFGKKLAQGQRIGFISQSGGMGSLTADWIEYTHLTAPPLSDTLRASLERLGTIPPYAVLLNPADVRGASVRGDAAEDTLRAFLQNPDFDMIVMLFARSQVTEESAGTAEAVIRASKGSEKPVIIVWSGQRQTTQITPWKTAPEQFKEASIPVFSQPSDLLKALAKIQRYWSYRHIWLHGFSGGPNDD
jgi:acetate---CoA ligase (ADP-forming)